MACRFACSAPRGALGHTAALRDASRRARSRLARRTGPARSRGVLRPCGRRAIACLASLNSCTGGSVAQPNRQATPMSTAMKRNITATDTSNSPQGRQTSAAGQYRLGANNPLRRRCTRERPTRFPTVLTDDRNNGLVLFTPRKHRRTGAASVPGRRDCRGHEGELRTVPPLARPSSGWTVRAR